MRASTLDDFWSRVEQRGVHRCWPWLGGYISSGYGRFHIAGKVVGAHRLALSLAVEPPDARAFACHHCDNKGCCNPLHLYWGTAQDNADDRDARRRQVRPAGFGHYATKDLTGSKWSALTVLFRLPGTGSRWQCQCECGRSIVVTTNSLIGDKRKSCGCRVAEAVKAKAVEAVAKGTYAGSRNSNARFDERTALDALRAVRAGETHKVVALRFGVSRSTVGELARGRTWPALQEQQ